MKIVLYNKREIELSLKEAEVIKEELRKGVNFIEIGNELINSKDIRGIFESEGKPSDFKRLPAPRIKEVSLEKDMERAFNFLKSKGLFENFNSYQEWKEKR